MGEKQLCVLEWHEADHETADESTFLYQEGLIGRKQGRPRQPGASVTDDKTNHEATGFLALLPSSRRWTA